MDGITKAPAGMAIFKGMTFGCNARRAGWLRPAFLEETPISEDRSLKLDGDEINLTATDSWQLTWWLMSQGDSIEVVSPVALRRKIAGNLADATAQHESGSA